MPIRLVIHCFTKTNFYFYTLRSTFQTYRQKEHTEKDQDSNKVSNSNEYINDRGLCT